MDGPVVVQEKVDGSQFSFGIFDGVLKMRSKNQEFDPDSPPKTFAAAATSVKERAGSLRDGWTYRGEYLEKPKHNVLSYDRHPKGNIALFDVAMEPEFYLTPVDVQLEGRLIDLEVVPTFEVDGLTLETLQSLLETESFLGGPKIEGVVIKNYGRFGPDKKPLMGKFVSEAFKEKHRAAGASYGPKRGDIIEVVAAQHRTEARFRKAVIHMREAGELTNTPADIGRLIAAVQQDILDEERDDIANSLFEFYWPQVRRAASRGVAEWYKDQLAERQFTQAA